MSIKRELSSDGKALLSALHNLKDVEARVGWFAENKYPDGTPVAFAAAQNELGNPSKRIPARPFLALTISHQAKNWQAIGEKGARAVFKNKATMEQVLKIIAEDAVGQIKKTIGNIFYPPLAPATIKARLSKYKNQTKIGALDKPLVDTEQMINSIHYELEKV
jgi:hypothetical protein